MTKFLCYKKPTLCNWCNFHFNLFPYLRWIATWDVFWVIFCYAGTLWRCSGLFMHKRRLWMTSLSNWHTAIDRHTTSVARDAFVPEATCWELNIRGKNSFHKSLMCFFKPTVVASSSKFFLSWQTAIFRQIKESFSRHNYPAFRFEMRSRIFYCSVSEEECIMFSIYRRLFIAQWEGIKVFGIGLWDFWHQSKDSCSVGLNSVSKIYLNRTP